MDRCHDQHVCHREKQTNEDGKDKRTSLSFVFDSVATPASGGCVAVQLLRADSFQSFDSESFVHHEFSVPELEAYRGI